MTKDIQEQIRERNKEHLENLLDMMTWQVQNAPPFTDTRFERKQILKYAEQYHKLTGKYFVRTYRRELVK